MIEFELVYIHSKTYISDTVLYAQPCNIDITIFERYEKLSIIIVQSLYEKNCNRRYFNGFRLIKKKRFGFEIKALFR